MFENEPSPRVASHREVDDLRAFAVATAEKMHRLTIESSEHRYYLRGIASDLAHLKDSHDDLLKQSTELCTRMLSVEAGVNDFRARFITLHDDVAAMKTEMATLATRAELDQVRVEVGEIKNTMATRVELAQVRTEIGDVRTEIGDLRTEMGEIRATMATKTELDEVRGEVGELRTEVGELRTEVGELRTEVGGLRTEVSSVTGKVDVLLAHFGLN
ncbi:hypothetical protein [Sphaerisporangium rufum]|nr:hypothetical protein [Sphaerisporangium rufum]